jgi:Prophage protein (DUF1660)
MWDRLWCKLFGHRTESYRGTFAPTGESWIVTKCTRCGATLYDGPGPPYHPNCRCTTTVPPKWEEERG